MLPQERGHASEGDLQAQLQWPSTRVDAALQKLLSQASVGRFQTM